MRAMSHPNIIDLRAFFYSSGDKVSSSPTKPSNPPCGEVTELELTTCLPSLPSFVAVCRRTR